MRWTWSGCSSTFTTARAGAGVKSKEIVLVDFRRSFYSSLELVEKQDLLRTPLNLSGRELGGLVVEAIAAVLSSATLVEKSLELDLSTD